MLSTVTRNRSTYPPWEEQRKGWCPPMHAKGKVATGGQGTYLDEMF